MQILLVEDDYALAQGLQQALQDEGFVVNSVASGEAAIYLVQNETPDMLILDIGLPDISGLAVLQKIRPGHPALPVLLLTARDRVEDKVLGLDSGADDYLSKPFDVNELVARIRAVERRLGGASGNQLTIGPVTLDSRAQTVQLDGQPLELSRREFMLLKVMMENSGRILSREKLEARLYQWNDDISSNAVEVHIHHLRKKLPTNFIKTVRGVGYTVRKA
ncbi:MAG TPA: response regulator [Pseudomonadales bacterium]